MSSDPMEDLRKMREKIAEINAGQAAMERDLQEPMRVLAQAREKIDSIDEMLAEKPVERERKAPTKPPAGLSADEEVQWWKSKIASLSDPPSNSSSSGSSAEDKENNGRGSFASSSSRVGSALEADRGSGRERDRGLERGYRSKEKSTAGSGEYKSYK